MKTSFQKFMASEAVKVELGQNKVELALLDDMKVTIDNAKARIKSLKLAEKQVIDLISTASKLQEKLQDEYGFANSDSVVIENALERTMKVAKDLGIDPNSIPQIKELKSIEQELLKAIIDADSTLAKYNG